MSETLDQNTVPGPVGSPEQPWLWEEWGHGLARAIEAMGAELPTFEKLSTGDQPQGEAALWWSQEFSLSPGPGLWIGAAEAAWTEIGATALRAVGIEPSNPVDVRDTYREILVQSLTSLGRSMTARCRQEVTCLQGEFLAAPPENGVAGFLRLQVGQGPVISLCALATAAFVEALEANSAAAATAEGQPAPTTAQNAAQSAVAALRSLSDLEMPISISFGTGQVPLQDALMLKRGSLVALEPRADEPVEFRVNDRIIARGEIVVVDDSYAVRIVELVSRGERLRCANSVQQAEALLPSNVG